jgi:hypothetical protein
MNPRKIKTSRDLRDQILILEEAKIQQEYAIGEHWENAKYQYRPANLARSAINSLIADGKANPAIIISTLGLGLGFLARKWVVGKSTNPLRKLAGAVVQIGVSGFLAKKDSANRTVNLLRKVFRKKNKPGLLPG